MEPRAGSSAVGGRSDSAPPASNTTYINRPPPRSLGEALRAAGMPAGLTRSGSETPSEEDYDQNVRPAFSQTKLRYRLKRPTARAPRPGIVRSDSGVHIVPEDDRDIQDFLEKSSQRAELQSTSASRLGRFSDHVFTHQPSAFDRNNVEAANSPFHGFYTLFWMAVAIFVFKISAENWRTFGNPLGSNEIIKTMFRRDGKLMQRMCPIQPNF